MMRVLVTGGTGFVGRHVIAALAGTGWEVHAVHGKSSPPSTAGIAWRRCDLLEAGAATQLIDAVRPSHLLHLAWYAEPGKFWNARVNIDWVRASLELATAFVERSGTRMVVAGSCAEYGRSDVAVNEESTLSNPATVYGKAKDALRRSLQALETASKVQVVWGRIFHLYGPHEAPGRLVSSVARALVRGEHAECSEGFQQRDFLHVRDVAASFVHLLQQQESGIFNIGSGTAISVRELVTTIAQHADAQNLVHFGALPMNPDEPPLIVADTQRLRATGWLPAISVSAGIAETVSWWRAQEGKNSVHE